MSRKSSRTASRIVSRAASVERFLDPLEEDEMYINKQEVLAEDESEFDQHPWNHQPSRSPEGSASAQGATPKVGYSEGPSRTWSRRSSPTRGEMLKMDDVMVTVHRGGMTMTIPWSIAHHCPSIPIGHLDDEGQTILDQMLNGGSTIEEIIEYFKSYVPKVESEMEKKMRLLTGGKDLTDEEMINLLKTQLGGDSKAKMDALLASGMSMKDVLETMMKEGKTADEEKEEFAKKMEDLLNNEDLTPEEKLNLMKEQLGDEAKAKMEEMLKSGMTMQEVIDHFIKTGGTVEKEPGEFGKMMKKLIGNGSMSDLDIINLMKSQLGTNSLAELEAMMKTGMSIKEVIDYFMQNGKTQKEEDEIKKAEFTKKMNSLMNDTSLSEEQKLDIMKNQLSEEAKAEMEEMLKSGMTMKEVMDHFMQSGGMKQEEKSKLAKNMEELMNGKDLNSEEILELLKAQLGSEGREQLEAMLKAGMSIEDVISHFMKNGKTSDEEQEEFAKKMLDLVSGKDLSEEEILDIMKSRLTSKDQAIMEEMLKNGMSMEDVINHFMKSDNHNLFSGSEESFKTRMENLMFGKDLSENEILELLKSQLGKHSLAELEKMLLNGKSVKEVLDYFMEHGKTKQQEEKEFTKKLNSLINGKNMTSEETFTFLKNNLGDEAKAAMDELLKQGYSMDEVINMFKKHGNNVQALDRDLNNKTFTFDDEPPDAHLHATRDVFSVISIDEVKSKIPYMSPSGKNKPFSVFFDKVQEVIKGKGLTHREILDLIRSRIGGIWGKEMDDLRNSGATLNDVVDYFMKKDAELRSQAIRTARLKAASKVDANVDLQRKEYKQMWGVNLEYSHSEEGGLQLIFGEVKENSPAWKSGIRPSDVIVTVNDWLITIMDKPQVAASLFQAGANQVKLGILKSKINQDLDRKALGVY